MLIVRCLEKTAWIVVFRHRHMIPDVCFSGCETSDLGKSVTVSGFHK